MKHIYGFLATSPLWINKQFGITQFHFPKIDLTSFIPKDIPTNLRLGHQVEHIFQQLISYDGTYNLLGHNLQLKRQNLTIGELDFLLQNNRTSQIHHVELTYKFYILDPSIPEPIDRAIGPNRKDMFFKKMEKTRDHHFGLLYSPEGLAALRSLNISEKNILQQCCFLAQLFVPYSERSLSIDPFNSDCISGYWLRMDELENTSRENQQYYIPTKYEWLHTPHNDVQWTSLSNCILEITALHLRQMAPMVWLKSEQGSFEKFFVTWW